MTINDTYFQLGHKHESADAVLYTYPTVKPILMSEIAVSSTELIAAGHAVSVPHVSGEDGSPKSPQSLCGIQNDKSHGSLTERDEGNWKTQRT
jgi:hypothetical protein